MGLGAGAGGLHQNLRLHFFYTATVQISKSGHLTLIEN